MRAVSVWAVIVHFGDDEPTRRLVGALGSATVVPDHVLVIDNARPGQELVGAVGPRVLRPGRNLGYSAAAAIGAEHALAGGADWVWVLNNDAEPVADCLERLLEAGAIVPDAGMLSPVIVYRRDGAVWYAGGSVTRRGLSVRHWTTPRTASAPYGTDFVTGCAPLIRLAAVVEVGALDQGLFMYYEDVDWSMRMQAAGRRLVVVPAAVVRHDVPREGDRRVFSDAAIYFMTRNRLLLAAGRGQRGVAALAGSGWALRQVAKSRSTGVAGRRLRAAALGVLHGLMGRRGAAPGVVGGADGA